MTHATYTKFFGSSNVQSPMYRFLASSEVSPFWLLLLSLSVSSYSSFSPPLCMGFSSCFAVLAVIYCSWTSDFMTAEVYPVSLSWARITEASDFRMSKQAGTSVY